MDLLVAHLICGGVLLMSGGLLLILRWLRRSLGDGVPVLEALTFVAAALVGGLACLLGTHRGEVDLLLEAGRVGATLTGALILAVLPLAGRVPRAAPCA